MCPWKHDCKLYSHQSNQVDFSLQLTSNWLSQMENFINRYQAIVSIETFYALFKCNYRLKRLCGRLCSKWLMAFELGIRLQYKSNLQLTQKAYHSHQIKLLIFKQKRACPPCIGALVLWSTARECNVFHRHLPNKRTENWILLQWMIIWLDCNGNTVFLWFQ